MFAGNGNNCYLYYSNNLLSGWTNHPANPIVRNNSLIARPGGRAFVFDHDRIIRLAQEHDVRYGRKVRAFEVTSLTETAYVEHEITGGAPFCPVGVFCERDTTNSCADPCADRSNIWNLCGMHNLDAWWTGEYWLVVTDGYKCLTKPNDWSIGMFISRPR